MGRTDALFSAAIGHPPQRSAMGKITAFALTVGTVAVLTVHPQSAIAECSGTAC
jgi:hypothetical protein